MSHPGFYIASVQTGHITAADPTRDMALSSFTLSPYRGSGRRCLASTLVGCTLGTLSSKPKKVIMAAKDKRQELRDKKQELREVKERMQADETPHEDKQALREKRKLLREEVDRLKSEPGVARE